MAAVLALAACSDPGPGKVHPYDRAPVPAVPDRTTEVPATGELPDGQYWATVTGATGAVPTPTITWTLVAASFDETGALHTIDDPSRELASPISALLSSTVVAADRQNYAVPADELLSLLSENAPSADAPEGFAYAEYPFLVTISNGAVIEVHQIWLES